MPLINNPIVSGDRINKMAAAKEPESPLFNHVVMKKLLSLNVLTLSDLKNFRLVCTFWHNVSLDYWCKRVVVKLVPNTKTRIGISVEDLENRYSKRKQDLSQLDPKPYPAYKVKAWKPKYDALNSVVVPAEFSFGPVVAPNVEYLSIEQCNFTHREKLNDIVLSCANLKELVITGNTCVPRYMQVPDIPEEKKLEHLKVFRVDGLMTMGWYQLMLHAPNVEKLIIKQNSSYSRDTFTGFLFDLSQLQFHHKFKWSIKTMDLSEATGAYAELACHCYHELPLETLTVPFEKYHLAERFKPLLQRTNKTLKCLHIIRVSDQIDAPTYNSVDFPCGVQMDLLSELYLWGGVVDNLDFFRFTPNLKILEIHRSNFEKRHLLTYCKDSKNVRGIEPYSENVDVVQRTVECWNNLTKQPTMWMEWLWRFFVDCKLGVGSMYTLRRWLPNVKALGIVFTNATFLLACEEWPKLEEIGVLYGSVVMDEAVTGGHFLSLKSLEKLTLDAYCNQGWLTDRAVHDGFMKMEKLRHLRMCVSKQMTVEAVNLLKGKIPHVKIIRNYGNGPHLDYDCCERMDFNKKRKSMYINACT